MIIREATPLDKPAIIELYKKSQAATNLPDPKYFPPDSLGEKLYKRQAMRRYVAVDSGVIVGHGIVERPNLEHIRQWKSKINNKNASIYELGAAFVDPARSGEGVWTKLLIYRIDYVKALNGVPVSVTWATNDHVKRVFYRLGGVSVGDKKVQGGSISLFVL